jgi:hypothetical protein
MAPVQNVKTSIRENKFELSVTQKATIIKGLHFLQSIFDQ